LYCIIKDSFSLISPVLIIGTVKDWQLYYCLSDHYSQEERALLNPILAEIGCHEIMESMFEIPKDKTVEEVCKILDKYSIMGKNPMFEEFVKK
jgi:hypothetical protein